MCTECTILCTPEIWINSFIYPLWIGSFWIWCKSISRVDVLRIKCSRVWTLGVLSLHQQANELIYFTFSDCQIQIVWAKPVSLGSISSKHVNTASSGTLANRRLYQNVSFSPSCECWIDIRMVFNKVFIKHSRRCASITNTLRQLKMALCSTRSKTEKTQKSWKYGNQRKCRSRRKLSDFWGFDKWINSPPSTKLQHFLHLRPSYNTVLRSNKTQMAEYFLN